MAPRFQAILLPGVVLPADLAYGRLVDALGDEADARLKDLELYRWDEPPPAYALDAEIEGVLHEADGAGFDRFHLVGYSGGGAAALAFAAAVPERVLSLALLEPAWSGSADMSARERAARDEFESLESAPSDELMPAFVRANLRPGVKPPPPPTGAPPPWTAKRPAGIRALTRAFRRDDLDYETLRRFRRPVYFALGALSNPDVYEEQARRLEGVFDDFTLEVFAERHHFDPPHRVEPERMAGSLLRLWRRAEGREVSAPDDG